MTDPEPIPISALEHHVYCSRQCALIHVDRLWSDNEHTVRGAHGHRRADEATDRIERGRQVARAVPLWSERLNLVGRADVVEFWADGTVTPVEYKIGSRHGAAAVIQLCAQALCLEEMLGTAIPIGFIWYSRLRRRERVLLDDGLRLRTEAVVAEVAEYLSARWLPPAVDDARCTECQLLDVCMPSLVARPDSITQYVERILCGS